MLILVNFFGILAIALIVWWFWLSNSQKSIVKAQELIEIIVKDGIYAPALIQAQVNHPITLRFIREDASPCSEFVLFNQLNKSLTLPLKTPTDITINLDKPGEYEFTCQMGMYRGKLIATP